MQYGIEYYFIYFYDTSWPDEKNYNISYAHYGINV